MNARRPVPVLILTLLLALLAPDVATPVEAQARADAPAGQMTWAVHISLAPVWFDPAEHTGIITAMMVLYAVHDAMVKPMPGKPFGAVAGRIVDLCRRMVSSTSSSCARASCSTTATP